MHDWNALCEEQSMAGWAIPPGTGGHEDHTWTIAADVSLDPNDAGTFSVTPGTGVLTTTETTHNLFTRETHRDCNLHIEFNVPEGSNSGVYLMGKYEIQILDSWGVEDPEFGDCGGIYGRYVDGETIGGVAPRVNASKRPGEWQTYDVVFRAPRFDDDGYKSENAVFERVEWNGELVHENVEVEAPTRASMPGPEWPRGPLFLQGDHGPIAYRNIRLTEL